MGELTKDERHVMEHATAWMPKKSRLYRNRFIAGPDHDDWATLDGLAERGLMRNAGVLSACGGMSMFTVTEAGIRALGGRDADVEKMRKEAADW